MKIAVDFDGTCVTHDFPKVGKEIGAVPILKKLTDNGHRIILYTMRCHPNKKSENRTINGEKLDNDTLQDAINWFKKHNIPLYGVNEDPKQKTWTTSPKAHCDICIDDRNLCTPLKIDKKLSDKPFVDWGKIEKVLKPLLEDWDGM